MSKYLFCVILGIIIFLMYNRINGFSIGGKDIGDFCYGINDEECNDGLGNCDDNCICFNYECVKDDDDTGGVVIEPEPVASGVCAVDKLHAEAIQIAENLIGRIRPDELDLSQNYDPFIEAIKYTLTNQNTPLFYTASRFYLTVVHLLRNSDITDLTLNDSSATLTPGKNSSIKNSTISGSICICNTDWNESASFYYFHRNNLSRVEIYSGSTKNYIKSKVSSEYHSIIDGLDENILFSRVLIILEPINDFDNTLQNNVLSTTSWGDNPRETNKEEIIQKNQNLSEWSEWDGSQETANQIRILYKKNLWKCTIFLSKEQRDVLVSFT
jgi:hypothetical protein